MQLVTRQHCKKVKGTFPAAAPSARSLWTFSYKPIAVIAKQLDCLVYRCFNNAASQHAKLDAPRAGLNPRKPESDVLLRRTLSDPDASGAANWTAGNFNSHVGSWCPCFPQREAGKGAGEGAEGTQLSNSNGGPSNSIITTKSTSSLPTRGPPPTSNEGLQHSALLFAA